ELDRALLEWKVLFFRDQDISRDDHRGFAARWGELEQHPFFKYTQPGQSDADVATLAKDATAAGTENIWHNDVTWHTRPSRAAVLRAVEIPPVGGDTLWADTGAAYDLLPEDMQEKLDGLTAEHDWIHSFGKGMDPADVERLRPRVRRCPRRRGSRRRPARPGGGCCSSSWGSPARSWACGWARRRRCRAPSARCPCACSGRGGRGARTSRSPQRVPRCCLALS